MAKHVDQFLVIRNFETFQHYRDRKPTWIKLYFGLLNDREFYRLPDAQKFHVVGLFLIASQCDNKIPLDIPWITRQLAATDDIDIAGLIASGFIEIVEQPASKPLAQRKPLASLEKKVREEVREEKREEPPVSPPVGDEAQAVTAQSLFDAYAEERGGLPEAQELTSERRRKCEARIRRHSRDIAGFFERFRGSIRRARDIPFMLGDGGRGWKASFDWFIANDTNYVKVLEGKYDGTRKEQRNFAEQRLENNLRAAGYDPAEFFDADSAVSHPGG